MSTYTPYTYLIGWSNLNKWYYGVRYSINCNPSEFWVTYFTSSKYVKDFRKKYGDPDVIKIRKTFSTSNEAIDWENRVLSRINIKDDKWLNMTNNKAIFLNDEMRQKINENCKGRKWCQNLKTGDQKMVYELPEGYVWGRTHKPKKRRVRSETSKEKVKESMRKAWDSGKFDNRAPIPDDARKRAGISNRGKKRNKKLCPYCFNYIAVNTYARFHGENCKVKNIIDIKKFESGG